MWLVHFPIFIAVNSEHIHILTPARKLKSQKIIRAKIKGAKINGTRYRHISINHGQNLLPNGEKRRCP